MGPTMGTLCTIGARPRRPGFVAGTALALADGVAELEGVWDLAEDMCASWMPIEWLGRGVGLGEGLVTKLVIIAWVGVACMSGRVELGETLGVCTGAWVAGAGRTVTGSWVGLGVSSATLLMPSSEGMASAMADEMADVGTAGLDSTGSAMGAGAAW